MPKLEKLSYYTNPQLAIAPASVNAGAITPVAVDGNGFDRARFVVAVGAVGTSGGVTAEITESATSGGTYTLISGSTLSLHTAADANSLLIVDVPVNSAKPYLKLRGTVGTAAIVMGGICDVYNGTRQIPSSPTHGDVSEELNV